MSDNSLIIVIATFLFFTMPIGALVWWKRKNNENFWPFAVGALCFFVFAMVLEQLLHYVCLKSGNALSAAIKGSALYCSLYGAFAAGIFEECGRLFGFKVLMKKYDRTSSAVAYGIGHGGMEVILLLAVNYFCYMLASFGVSFGAEADPIMQKAVSEMTAGPVFTAVFERIGSMIFHVGASLIVFYAVKKKICWLFAAILIHAAVNIPAGFFAYGLIPLWTVEIWCFVIACAALFVGIKLNYLNNQNKGGCV